MFDIKIIIKQAITRVAYSIEVIYFLNVLDSVLIYEMKSEKS